MALGKSAGSDLVDNRSISEYYAELFSYAPAILSDAIKYGEPYERFKMCVKFAFSILHCMQMQDVVSKKPIIPILGETYEGIFVMPEGNVDIFMESDYIERRVVDLVSNQTKATIKKDQETTYIAIQGPKNKYSINCALTYNQSWKGNNMIISLIGDIKV